MISFIKFFIKMSVPDNMSPKKFIIYLIVGLTIFWIFIFYISYIGKKQKIEEYKRIEQETKVFHEENIQKLKTTLNNAKNAKKSDFNDTGNLDDDYLLEALE
jgi:hypothetical protein